MTAGGGRGPGRRVRLALATAAVLLAALPRPAAAQGARGVQASEQRLRQQRDELDRIRRERDSLQRRMRELSGNERSLREQTRNLDRQAEVTALAVRSIESQLDALVANVGGVTGQLARSQDELLVKRAVLARRLGDIYKRGPLYTMEALLSAQSFGELVARYKYLHSVAQRDRALVARVEQLSGQIDRQRSHLLRLQQDMEVSRELKADEERRLRELEEQRRLSLADVQRESRRTAERIARYSRDEARLASIVTNLEAARRNAERRAATARLGTTAAPRPSAASSLRTADLGRLDWPVEGTIIYQFGRVVNPDNTATRWNGVGIEAATGTAVRTVAAGEVMLAETIGTYGRTVIVQHGGGDYSVYGSLARLDVRKGQAVTKGQVVGAVGAADPDLPPHLHFEIRPNGRATDPLTWLRDRR